MLTTVFTLALVVILVALAYANAAGYAWALSLAVAIGLAWTAHLMPTTTAVVLACALATAAVSLLVPVVRRSLISDNVLGAFRKALPPMSQTERDAIEAGTVWWDGELFSGRPDWRKLLGTPAPTLSAEEKRFLDREC